MIIYFSISSNDILEKLSKTHNSADSKIFTGNRMPQKESSGKTENIKFKKKKKR